MEKNKTHKSKKKIQNKTQRQTDLKIYYHSAVLSATVHVRDDGVCVCVCVCACCVCSHLSFLLDFEELCHVREVFLVGFSHLLLCSLRVHDLQPLQTRAERLASKINLHSTQEIFKLGGCSSFLPAEE